MRIYKSHDMVGILVAPGDLLISDDMALVGHVKKLEGLGELPVQQILTHLNQGGYTVHGAYQLVDGPTDRERETKLFETGRKHALSIGVSVVRDSRPVAAQRDEDRLAEVTGAATRLAADNIELQAQVKQLEAELGAKAQELEAKARELEAVKGKSKWFQ